jgi:hypothetical protein
MEMVLVFAISTFIAIVSIDTAQHRRQNLQKRIMGKHE